MSNDLDYLDYDEKKKELYKKYSNARSKSSMVYFWNLIKDLNLPMPKTEVIPVDRWVLVSSLDTNNLPTELLDKIKKIIKDKFTYPVFIRTSESSGKHSWNNSCYIENEDKLEHNVLGVIEMNELADVMGLDYEALLIREYIPMNSGFIAFHGKMPVNPERRYFIRNGKVECHHPYWIEDSIEHPDKQEWREILKGMNTETEEEIKLLTSYAEQVGKVLPMDYWSIDFCQALDKRWILIDLAHGDCSYHPKCEVKPK